MLGTVDKKVLAGDFEVLAVGPGLRALYLFKNVLVHIGSPGPGFPVARVVMPMPPGGGRVIAGSASDVSVVTDDGTLWYWMYVAEVWERVGNPREGA